MIETPATGTNPMAVLFSASQAYLRSAAQGLQRRFGGVRVAELAPEVGRMELAGYGPADVAEACRQAAREPGLAFVRHLATEASFTPAAEVDRVPEVVKELALRCGAVDLGLQVWGSGQVVRRPPELRADVEAALAGAGVTTARGGREQVLSICLTPAGAHSGITLARDMLADWPGGRVVLGRRAEQVSRAEWKLEELLKLVGTAKELGAGDVGLDDLALGPDEAGQRRRALDLGASPGGWTRILRLEGYEVWAVDPGDLHPAVAADPEVHHEVTTAGQFLATAPAEAAFDLVVNDMRMVAERSCQVMVQAARRLRPGGLAVVTLKVSQKRPAATVERALKVLGKAYEPTFVRQLYHNKNEVTVVARRR